jgi:hypothetical protein
VAPLFAMCRHRPCASFAMTLPDDCVGLRNIAQPGLQTPKALSPPSAASWQVHCRQRRNRFAPAYSHLQRWAAPRLLPPDVPCVGVHRASLTPDDPPRAPTTKDFAEKGGPVEIWQSSWLSAPDRPEQGRDKIDVLLFYKEQSNF